MKHRCLKTLFRSLCCFVFLGGFLCSSLVAQHPSHDKARAHLHHKDPHIRAAQARLIGENGKAGAWAIEDLIQLLSDDSESVREAAHNALKNITGKTFPPDQERWRTWNNNEGNEMFSGTVPPPSASGDSVPDYLVFGMGFVVLIFVVVFSIIGGYRLKKLKEVMREAEKYVSQAEEAMKASDKISDQLEQKKVEMREYFSELKEEKEGELERHTELLEQNSAQRIREEMSSLREQAEKEVEHTLNDLQEDVRKNLERELNDMQSEMEESLNELHERFENEAEAQRIFLEASMYDLTDKPDEALEKYNQVLEMKPDHHLAIQRKAGVLKKKERYETALNELEQALEHSPESPSLLYDIARTYALMNRKDRMLEYLEKSISIDSEYKDEALNDEAFKGYWDDRAFKDLAEG